MTGSRMTDESGDDGRGRRRWPVGAVNDEEMAGDDFQTLKYTKLLYKSLKMGTIKRAGLAANPSS